MEATAVLVRQDADRFGLHVTAGGWQFALLVARSARRGGPVPSLGTVGAAERTGDREPRALTSAGKVSLREFATMAGCDQARVSRYLRAWERAAQAGRVTAAEELSPGQETALPAAEEWAEFFSAAEATNDRRQQVAAEAEAIGTSFHKALEITGNRPALRAAILGDPRTAAAATQALLQRPQTRAQVLTEVMADAQARREVKDEERRAEHAEFVRRVLTEGKARTGAGQSIAFTPPSDTEVRARLEVVHDSDATAAEVEDAYHLLGDLIDHAVHADPVTRVQEQRRVFAKAFATTVRTIQNIDRDALMAVADNDLTVSLAQLQQHVNDLVTAVGSSAKGPSHKSTSPL